MFKDYSRHPHKVTIVKGFEANIARRDCHVCRRLIRSFFFSKGVASTGVDMRKRASWPMQLPGFIIDHSR